MCFSPEASFTASIGLTTIGVIAYKKAGYTDLRLLAAIPFFFGIQQFMEGLVWLSNLHDNWAWVRTFSTYGFIFFAWIVWPLFLPFSYLILEKFKTRKRILLVIGIIGLFVSSVLTYIMLTIGVESRIEDCSIAYNFNFRHDYEWIFGILYLSTTVLPNFVSSMGKIWLLGIANFVTYFVSKIYYNDHIISVWCFFAAISSVIILYVIVDKMKQGRRL